MGDMNESDQEQDNKKEDQNEAEEFIDITDTIPLKENADNHENGKNIELVAISSQSREANRDVIESSTVACDYYVDTKTNEVLLNSTEKLDITGEITDIEDPTEPNEIIKEKPTISRCCVSWNICSLLSFKTKSNDTDFE